MIKKKVKNFMNGRRQRSVTVDWNIQNRKKPVALKLVSNKPGKAAPSQDTEGSVENADDAELSRPIVVQYMVVNKAAVRAY